MPDIKPYLEMLKYTLTLKSLATKAGEVPWSILTEEERKELKTAFLEREREIIEEIKHRPLYSAFLDELKRVTTHEERVRLRERVLASPMPTSMKEAILKELERIPEKKEEIAPPPPLIAPPPPIYSPLIDRELSYLESQYRLGMHMHPEIANSLARLRVLGYPEANIEEWRKKFL